MAQAGRYYGQDLTWLTAHRDTVKSAIDAVVLGRTVSIGGRTVSREDLESLKDDLFEAQSEINRQTNTNVIPRTFYADFSGV